MATSILVIEDEDPKLEGILKFLREYDETVDVRVARSVKAGLETLRDKVPEILLLDMSLPTFDITGWEPGGRPQGFGGIEVIRYLDSLDVVVPTIIVSAYEAFSRDGTSVELKDLESELVGEFPQMIRGVVYFNPVNDLWSEQLSVLVRASLED